MRRFCLFASLTLLLVTGVGCQCYRVTRWYGNAIDTVSDYKMRLDPLYVPGLDISRTGMPDWRRFGINDLLCPCGDGIARRNKRPVYYPAEYRSRFWTMQAELESQSGYPGETDALPPLPLPEEAPLPLPAAPME